MPASVDAFKQSKLWGWYVINSFFLQVCIKSRLHGFTPGWLLSRECGWQHPFLTKHTIWFEGTPHSIFFQFRFFPSQLVICESFALILIPCFRQCFKLRTRHVIIDLLTFQTVTFLVGILSRAVWLFKWKTRSRSGLYSKNQIAFLSSNAWLRNRTQTKLLVRVRVSSHGE